MRGAPNARPRRRICRVTPWQVGDLPTSAAGSRRKSRAGPNTFGSPPTIGTHRPNSCGSKPGWSRP